MNWKRCDYKYHMINIDFDSKWLSSKIYFILKWQCGFQEWPQTASVIIINTSNIRNSNPAMVSLNATVFIVQVWRIMETVSREDLMTTDLAEHHMTLLQFNIRLWQKDYIDKISFPHLLELEFHILRSRFPIY